MGEGRALCSLEGRMKADDGWQTTDDSLPVLGSLVETSPAEVSLLIERDASAANSRSDLSLSDLLISDLRSLTSACRSKA
jgi:hypothetical protein